MLKHSAFTLPPLPRRTSNAEDNVLPLINVVFLLLIFFMVSGSLIPEPPFKLTPPTTQHAGAQDAQPDYLAIAADGSLAWVGEAINTHELAGRLSQRREPNAPLQIRADRRLEAKELTQLLAELRAAGVAKIQLLTENQ
ncbi:MAG TPA: biopolymer transporter ExbD [Cellvibrionaceae bacterium]